MFIYQILSVALYPFLEIYLFWRVYKKKEDKKRLKERFGISKIHRPAGGMIWVHAVSVGESNSALILVEKLLQEFSRANILFTTTTLTSAAIIEKKITKFKGRVIHQFLPIDSYFCVQNFFNYWSLDLAIFVESEIWPNMLFEAKERNIPTFLVNARLSERSLTRWSLAKFLGVKIFDQFEEIYAQSKNDQERISKLTKKPVMYFGNLKSQANNLDFDQNEFDKLRLKIMDRALFIAVSTHKGEEEQIVEIHQNLKNDFPNLLTIIVPRHPNRAEEIVKIFGASKYAIRSKKDHISAQTDFYLADSLGELGMFYSLADFAFIGGSLAEVGGHNPFEAIKLNCAIISGDKIFNFKDIYSELEQKNSCVIVKSKEQLEEKVAEFLRDKQLAQSLAKKALEVVLVNENIVEKIVNDISSKLN